MAKPTFSNAAALLDPLTAESYTMLFASIPGASLSINELSLRCVSAIWEGVSIRKNTVAYSGGHELHYTGPTVFGGNLTLRFVEDRQQNVVNALRQYKEYVKGTESANSQAYKAGYAVNGTLIVYDTAGATAGSMLFTNLFITEISAVDFSPQGVIVDQTASFSYDRVDITAVPST